MHSVRRAAERGHENHGWLDSFHTFSFADYYDPAHMGFRALRVINEDRVEPGNGFGAHGHREMEIISYVLDGALRHDDSTGGGSVIRPGDVQRMSAGTGVRHSERNQSTTEQVHFLQIWLLPSKTGVAPGYEQKSFAEAEKRGRFRLVASPDGADGSVSLHADARLFAGLFGGGESAEVPLEPGRHAWLQLARGHARVTVAGDAIELGPGDGLRISDVTSVRIEGIEGIDGAEALLFDLA